VPAINDQFFIRAVRPYTWFAAVMLFLSYIIGLWFTLRTHAAVIWNSEVDEKKAQPHPGMNGSISNINLGAHAPAARHSSSSKGTVGRNEIRESQLYKRILGQSMSQAGLGARRSRQVSVSNQALLGQSPQTPHLVPPKSSEGEETVTGDTASYTSIHIPGLSEEENAHLVRQVAEMAATAATVAARDATTAPRKASHMSHAYAQHTPKHSAPPTGVFRDHEEGAVGEGGGGHAEAGGHDAPNWSRKKSAVILLGATVLYAVIAEILVNTVDVVLESVEIDEKFLGITLFALVPNTTEFLVGILFFNQAISADKALPERHIFRDERQHCVVHGNWFSLDLSTMGYGDGDTLRIPPELRVWRRKGKRTLSVEVGKSKVNKVFQSNYFKGSILVLTYLVIVVGFYVAGYSSDMDVMGVDRFDTLALGQQSFKTVGRPRSGRAY
ncbi:MAG: hypothetical protein Q9224_006535, partial [Gallowayella concinna]